MLTVATLVLLGCGADPSPSCGPVGRTTGLIADINLSDPSYLRIATDPTCEAHEVPVVISMETGDIRVQAPSPSSMANS